MEALGKALQRHGVDVHIVTRRFLGLKEYEEMEEHYRNVHQLLAPEGGTVQMLGRLGYGPEISPTPRWPLEAKLMHA